MVIVMLFNNSKALSFLLKNKIVATLRNRRYRVGQYVLIKVMRCGVARVIGIGQVVEVHEVTEENLRKFYKISGFSSPEEWLQAYRRISKSKSPKFIYVIKLLKLKSYE